MAEGSNYIIRYLADVSQVTREAKKIEKLNKQLINQYGKNAPKAVKVLGSEIKKVSERKVFNAKGVQTGVVAVQKLGTSFQTADGKLMKLTETNSVANTGIKKTTSSFSNMDKNTVSLGENISRLAKRAALTIPLWLALRSAFTGTIQVIKTGIKDIISFDERLQKLKRNLQGTPQEIEQNFDKAKKSITEFALISGVSVEELTTAMQRFATTGQDFETSFSGAIASAKLATIEFGDTVDIADALARSYKILGDSIDSNVDKTQRLAHVASLIDELWKTNAFDINELGDGLERFSSVANTMNVSMEDSIKLLATLHSGAVTSTRSGRLLSNSISKMVSRLDELQSSLGIEVNPEMDTTASVLLKVIDRFVELRKAGDFGSIADTSKMLKDIFQIRGKLPIESLVALRDVLAENLEATGDITKFNDEFSKVIITTAGASKRLTQAQRELGKAFVSGLTGEEDFAKALTVIADTLVEIRPIMRGFGKSINFVGEQIFRLLKLTSLLGDINIPGFEGLQRFSEIGDLFEAIDKSSNPVEFFNNLIKQTEDGADKTVETMAKKFREDLPNEINKSLDSATKKIDTDKLSQFINDLEVKISRGQVNVSRDTLNALKRGLESELERQGLEVEATNVSIRIPEDAREALLESRIKELEATGALTSEILKYEQAQRDSLGVGNEKLDNLKRQLDLERALKEEKRLQAELGNESLKLFRIARDEGSGVARKISDVLSGDVDFSSFVRRGGEAVDIFKKEFSNLFEQQQAKQFFKGETVSGLQGLRGGFGVNIQEESIRRPVSTFDPQLELLRRRTTGLFQQETPATTQRQTQTSPVNVGVNNNINVDISNLNEIQQKFVDEVAKQLPQAGSKLNQALAKSLYNKQVRSV